MAGRPTKYEEKFNEQVYKLCLLGATDEEIADFLEIATSTLYEWKNKYNKFSEAIKNGKIKADAEVAESLFNRAKGYEFIETRVEQEKPKEQPSSEDMDMIQQTADEEVLLRLNVSKVITIKKHIPADIAAGNIWLKNRRPKDWKERRNEDEGIKPPTIIINNGKDLPDE